MRTLPKSVAAFALATSVIALPAQTSAATKEVLLEPATPWQVDWADTSCMLARGFGSKNNMSIVRFEKFEPAERFQMVVTSRLLEGLENHEKTDVIFSSRDGSWINKFTLDKVLFGSNKDRSINLYIPSTTFLDPAGEVAPKAPEEEFREKE